MTNVLGFAGHLPLTVAQCSQGSLKTAKTTHEWKIWLCSNKTSLADMEFWISYISLFFWPFWPTIKKGKVHFQLMGPKKKRGELHLTFRPQFANTSFKMKILIDLNTTSLEEKRNNLGREESLHNLRKFIYQETIINII